MKSLLEQIKAIEIFKTLDLTEFDDAYRDDEGNPLVLRYRVNLTLDQKKALWDARAARDGLLKEFETFQKETEPDEEKADDLTERLRAGKQDFYAWWSTVIQSAPGQYATPEEIAALADEGRLWEWINSTIQTRILEYEIGITKKAAAAPGVTSGARQSKRPAS